LQRPANRTFEESGLPVIPPQRLDSLPQGKRRASAPNYRWIRVPKQHRVVDMEGKLVTPLARRESSQSELLDKDNHHDVARRSLEWKNT